MLAVNLTALLERADVLDAFALFICFAHIAVDQAVGRKSLTATIASLPASVMLGMLAVHLYNLATLAELAARNWARTSLFGGVQIGVTSKVRRVDLMLAVVRIILGDPLDLRMHRFARVLG